VAESVETPLTDQGGGGESKTTVIIAFLANLAIALAKTVAALVSGSASMLAESAHSWADTGNEVLLLIAEQRSKRPRDDTHPFGYGREAYVWSMFAAMGLFSVGGAVSVWHGVTMLLSDGGGEASYFWSYIVLAVSFVFEGISFLRAFKQTRTEADKFERETLEHALDTSDPTLRAVFAEDSAALVGLVIAGLGIFLHQATGDEVYDAVGSILIGILLGVVAIVLIEKNRRFLAGQQTDDRIRDAVLDRIKALPEVENVTYLRLEYVGPHQVLLVAAVDMRGNYPESEVAYALRRLEGKLETNPNITDAVLTLATPDETAL
jgi:cation diffusion facilitator family transporter